jgi:His-Xaa-Ser system radical SAM maturase HxsB
MPAKKGYGTLKRDDSFSIKPSQSFKKAAPFNYKKIGEQYLLVNEWGDFVYLSPKELKDFKEGKNHLDSELYQKLKENNFLKDELNVLNISEEYGQKKSYLFGGPSLHIAVVTLRCTRKCSYCHASAQNVDDKRYDMDKETAEKMLDIIFSTSNGAVAIEFQGGEPLLNLDIVKYITEEAHRRNKKAKKDLELRLVTNCDMLNEDLLDYFFEQKVSICVSMDGPKELHDSQRGQGNYNNVVSVINNFRKRYPEAKENGYIWDIAPSLTTTRSTLKQWKKAVDNNIELGFDRIYLRMLNPFGFSKKDWRGLGYTPKEFCDFYRKAMDYIIEINNKGTIFREKLTETFLKKIFSEKDPNHLEFRSPCGAGIGQLAYNYNGDVYTCDEGRMLSMMGDDAFQLGNVFNDSYKKITTDPVVKTCCIASCIESLPGCESCVYKPYCGVCPIYNYSEYGDVFAQTPNNDRCKIMQYMYDYLFEKMQDKKCREIFISWIFNKY